jgi:MraZ protein
MRAWERFEERVSELPSMDPHIVRFRRVYLSAAMECELDRAGRLLVPQDLRDKINLDKEALWAGMGRIVELWSRKRWDTALQISAEQEAEFRQAVLEQIRI